jgi:2-succinyl-6-hydroxy-2,4-cyclohexadiene-1-carboxylate synthase
MAKKRESMIVEINHVRYHIQICGEGAPLILLHGFTGDISTWEPFCEKWSQHARVIMVDLIGHGKTGSPLQSERYRMEEAVKDLNSIFNLLKIDKADILGYSMGGRLSLSFAVTHPQKVRKLILESASPGLKTAEERIDRQQKDLKLATFLIEKGMEEFVDYWEKIPLFQSHQNLSEQDQEELKKQRLANSITGLANSLIGMGTGSQPSWWEEIENLHCEVLFVTGEWDQKFCGIAEEMQKRLKYSTWTKVNDCGHTIHVEQAEKFATIVSRFLSNT